MNLGNISQIINTASVSIQKQYEKNPTATVITGLALGALGVVTLARQVNCPPKIPHYICKELDLPKSSRGRCEHNAKLETMYVYPAEFNLLTLRWTESDKLWFSTRD